MLNVHVTFDSENIATVMFDAAGKSVNTLSPTVLSELAEAVTEIELKNPAGVIFASAKPRNFIAGADLFAIRDMNAEQMNAFIKEGQMIAGRIERLQMPTVAAINGDCLGGGLEMALACRHRIASADTSISIGLPETRLGIVPGFGGSVRLVKVIGILNALPLMLAGKTLPPKKAARLGMVDETVRSEALMDAARRWIRKDVPVRRASWLNRAAASIPLIRRRILSRARQQAHLKTHGHYPALFKLLDVIETTQHGGDRAGLDAERAAILQLGQTDTCKNLMRIFFLKQAARRAAAGHVSAEAKSVHRVAVVGGGAMGAGICHALITSKIPVRLIEVNDEAISAALGRVNKILADDVRSGRMDELAAKHAFNRLSPTSRSDGIGICDFAIEAVIEKLDVKRQVIAKLEAAMGEDAVIASNTSSLLISDIAMEAKNSRRIVGMHFFNPVNRMPLVEIVRSTVASDSALATAIELGARLGKTPVLVHDCPGFLVNRTLIPYLADAAELARQGVPITQIDTAAKRFGWPMGPFELLDEIGLDVAAEVVRSLRRGDVARWLDEAIAHKWLGKKTGRGFYIYDKKHAPKINAELAPTGIKAMEDDEIMNHLMRPMVEEARRALAEGVVATPGELDLALVMGLGFPPYLGGLATYANLPGTSNDQESNRRQYAHI